ncbi:MAG: hypothetical protein ACE5GU_06680, partial [Candidatus Scalinduaceae bacterium]
MNNATHNLSKSPFTMGRILPFNAWGVRIWIIKKGKNLNDSYPFNNSSYYARSNLRTSMSSSGMPNLRLYQY